jgi:hypothetical protein
VLDLLMIDIFIRGSFKYITMNESCLCVRLIQLCEPGSSVGIVISLWAGVSGFVSHQERRPFSS